MTLPLWERYRNALSGEPLPCAFVDVPAFNANIDTILRAFLGRSKTLRIATKSIRSLALVRHVVERAGATVRGLMTYTAGETAFLAAQGERDLLLAYPTADRHDAVLLAAANLGGATAAVVVDDVRHLELLDHAARGAGAVIPVVIDADMALEPFSALHVGVRRSPLRGVGEITAFARATRRFPGIRLHGVMGYEAQIAGVADSGRAVRAMKAVSKRDVASRRKHIAAALLGDGFKLELFNGGGTGSLESSLRDDSLTEVTVGSGFLDSHLFDGYDELSLTPAAYFALQVARAPTRDIVTCHGGGYVASGAPSKDRLPIPALPEGLSYTRLEGAGEVQTPLHVPPAVRLGLGEPVFFRHAKAGELAEHFREYLLLSGETVVGRAPTYRGLGLCFLG